MGYPKHQIIDQNQEEGHPDHQEDVWAELEVGEVRNQHLCILSLCNFYGKHEEFFCLGGPSPPPMAGGG
jgi:hypothetical protein